MNLPNAICNSVICPKYGPLVELKRHCHNIARFFIFENPYDQSTVASWFQIASGINEVIYISDLFDDLAQWCGPAIDYENDKSKFNSKLIRELTRFSFIWGGLEAYLESEVFPSCPKRKGKVNSVNYFLKNSYINKYPHLEYYSKIQEFLKERIIDNPWFGDTSELFSEDECTSREAVGLKVVYKIRNLFAHGAFQFNEPEEYSLIKPYDIQIIMTSSRLVLLTIQMLLLSSERNLKFNVAQLHENEEKGVSAIKFISNMHLKSFKYS